MAFMGIFLSIILFVIANLAVILLILGMIFLTGIAVFVIGLAAGRSEEHRTMGRVLKAAGIIGMVLPVILTAVFIGIADTKVNTDISSYELPYERIAAEERRREGVVSFLSAADNDSRDEMYSMLDKGGFSAAETEQIIDVFLDTYPTGLSEATLASSITYDGSGSFSCEYEEDHYYIKVIDNAANSAEPYRISRLTIENEAAAQCRNRYDNGYPLILGCMILYNGDYKDHFAYEEYSFILTPDRTLTEEDFSEFFTENRTIKEVREHFGDPNGICRQNMNRGVYVYYLDGSEKTAEIIYLANGDVLRCYIYNFGKPDRDIWTFDMSEEK